MRRFKSWVEGVVVGLTVVALCLCTLILLMRVFLPDLSAHKGEIEDYLSQRFEAKVTIQKMALTFSGIEPALDLEGVSVGKEDVTFQAKSILAHLHVMRSFAANGWRIMHYPLPDLLFGDLTLNDVSVTQQNKIISLHKIETDLIYGHSGDEISLMLSRLTVRQNHRVKLPAFFLRFGMLDHAGKIKFTMQGKDVPLEVAYMIEPMVPLDHSSRRLFNALFPRGTMTQFATEFSDTLHFLTMTVRDFSVQPHNGFPGVEGAALHLDYAPGKASISFLESDTVTTVFMPKVFKSPFEFKKLAGDINLWVDANHITVQSNNIEAHLPNAQILSTFTFDSADKGRLSLHTKLEGEVTPLNNLVPLSMNPSAYRWLSQAFKGGKLHAADVVFEGSFKDFPFENHEGTLLFSAATDDLTLKFDTDWPAIDHLNGSVWGDGCTLHMEVPEASTHNAPLKNITATLSDICNKAIPTHLVVQGTALGNMEDGVAYLLQSPLKNPLGDALDDLKPKGPMNLDLSLKIAISDTNVDTKVAGILQTQTVVMQIPDVPAVLQNIKGQFSFTEKGLTAKTVSAQLGEIPLTFDINSTSQNNVSEIGITVLARPTVPQLEKAFKTTISDLVQGQANVQATINLQLKEPMVPSLKFQSDLEGMKVLLPPPFAKEPVEKKNFIAEPVFENNAIMGWQLFYDQKVSVALGRKKQNEPYPVTVYFGDKKEPIPTQPGLLIAGTLPEFSMSDFSGLAGSKSGNMPFLGANVVIKQFNLGEAKFNDVEVDFRNSPDYINVYLKSPNLAGAVRLPQTATHNGTKIALDRLKVDLGSGKESGSQLKPQMLKDFMPLEFSVNQLSVNNTRLGKVYFQAKPSAIDTVIINALRMDGPLFALAGEGHWYDDRTELKGNLDLRSLGDLLGVFADAKLMTGGAGRVDYQLNWPGAPVDFSIKKSSGKMGIQLKEGQLLGIEPGLGRMFSLLSIDEWQRRIQLNFSDVIQKGFAFDWIRGNFNLVGGNASTNDTEIKGSAADMKIKGQINVAQSLLNLDVLVTPNVNAGLPIAAAVAAANPAVGAAVWIFDKLFSPKIGTIAQNRYLVAGNFKDPKVTRVSNSTSKDKKERNGKKVR